MSGESGDRVCSALTCKTLHKLKVSGSIARDPGNANYAKLLEKFTKTHCNACADGGIYRFGVSAVVPSARSGCGGV